MSQNLSLPPWADQLREFYLSGEASIFILHGNVRDLVPWSEEGAPTRFLPLREFLQRYLSRSKDIIGYYNCSEGLELASPAMRREYLEVVSARRKLKGLPEVYTPPLLPGEALEQLEQLITQRERSAAVILDYSETLVPSGDLSFMSVADKANLVRLQRWAWEPGLQNSDNIIILVTENLGDINPRVVATAQLLPISVPLPDEAARAQFIRGQDLSKVPMELDEEQLVKHTAGLNLVQVRGIFRSASRSQRPISFRTVSRKKKALIEQECHGLVEFVEPRHDFSHVGGMDQVKEHLMRIAHAIRSGHRNRVPMGLIFVGPMGTGKTYLAEAFAGESGLTCLKFKNFRDKWVGSTEANLEKILSIVDALGYVLLLIDEADRSLSAGGENDGGTGSRVIARLKEFMSDTSHRGRVVIVMMTNRPDKLDSDLKRPGRFDVKIPFFFPESPEDRERIMLAVGRKSRLVFEEDLDLGPAAEHTQGYSSAELEAVLLAASGIAAEQEREAVSGADVLAAAQDVLPSRDIRILELMELLAVFEASSKKMLPDRYRSMETTEVLQRLDAVKRLIGPRLL